MLGESGDAGLEDRARAGDVGEYAFELGELDPGGGVGGVMLDVFS